MKRMIAILIFALFSGTVSYIFFQFESYITNYESAYRWADIVFITFLSLVIIEAYGRYIQYKQDS